MESQTSVGSDFRKDVPSVESSDPNERKLARRMRIQARLETARREKAKAEGTYVEPQIEKPLITETTDKCEDTLQQLYLEGKEYVTNIMVARDAKEFARKEQSIVEKNDRLEALKRDTAIGNERLKELTLKWKTLEGYSPPLEIYENVKDCRAKCLELIEMKNEEIKNFQMELKMSELNFIKDVEVMQQELSLLTKRIDEQVLVMKKAFRTELAHVEDSIDTTRTQIIDQNEKIWQNLYQKREKQEISNMSRKFKLVENFHEELRKLHEDHEEKFRELRIHLERDIQTLEQELEQVKALCLLNSEKLDYNYQILKKREEENVYIKNHQKRRLNKLQDRVNTLKRKTEEKRQFIDEEHKRLTKDVRRYYKNILDTENKAERFSCLNNDTFLKVWDMKDKEAKDLLEKILMADMVIHEQILGSSWSAPPNTKFNITEMPSYQTAVSIVKNVSRARRGSIRDSVFIPAKSPIEEDDLGIEGLEGRKRLLRHIFELIADHSGFLMEQKLDELLKPYTEYEKTFVRLDNVFVAIGLRTEEDIEALKSIFLPYSTCLICNKRITSVVSSRGSGEKIAGEGQVEVGDEARSKSHSRQQSILQIRELEEKVSKLRLQAKAQEGDTPPDDSSSGETRFSKDSVDIDDFHTFHAQSTQIKETQDRRVTPVAKEEVQCNITHPLVIEKFYVLRALKDFVSVYNADRLKILTGLDERTQLKRFTVSRLLLKDEISSYWSRYTEFPSKIECVWDGVYSGLTKYLDLLKDRHKLNRKAQKLRRQNLELKKLLNIYKSTDTCGMIKLPVILPVPNEPIDPLEIAYIGRKLAF